MRVLLELLRQLVHLLRCFQQSLALGKVVYLFCCCSLCDLLNLIYLVLSFCDGTHLDSCVVVVIDAAEIARELFVENARAKVLLALDELQVVSVVRCDCLVHLIEEALGSLRAITSARHKTNEDDVEKDMALKGRATGHRLHAHFVVPVPRAFWNSLHPASDAHGLIVELAFVEGPIHQLLEDDHVAVTRDKAVVNAGHFVSVLLQELFLIPFV